MRPDRVFVSGSMSIPHPVSDRLLAGLVPAKPASEAGDLKGYRLVVVDARLAGGDLAADGIAHRALEAGVAVLVLAPSQGQLQPLGALLGAVSHAPVQAVFIAPATNAERRFEVRSLGYPGVAGNAPGQEQPRRPRKEQRKSLALSRFVSHVESRLERGYEFKARVAFPDGLRWFSTLWSDEFDFVYATTGETDWSNGEGLFSFDYTIWAFLNQTPDAEMTYIVTEGTYTCYPGTLASNDEDARCVMTLKLQSGTRPTPEAMEAVDHIPTSGSESWTDSFDLDISYLTPFGSYAIYTFDVSVSQTISSWSVQNTSEGTMARSTWYVNSPVNGLTFPEDQNDAFNGSGHVEPFPSACTGTLTVKDASAWRTPGRYEGSLPFECDAYAHGWSLFGTACGLAFCYDPDADGTYWRFFPWFDVHVVL
jgi:hypothetical protein